MNYIEDLEKKRNEILNMENENPKSPMYKILAYRTALDDFIRKEYEKFKTDVIKTIPNAPVPEENYDPLEADSYYIYRISSTEPCDEDFTRSSVQNRSIAMKLNSLFKKTFAS